MEQFQAIVPDLFDEMGLPAVESVQPAEDSSNNLAPVLISTASGNYRADYGVSEETAQLTFLALDGAFLICAAHMIKAARHGFAPWRAAFISV